MNNNSNTRSETPAFGIALFVFAVLFIVFLNQLPFPEDYEFINYAGIFIGCCFIVGFIFVSAVSLINAIYKIIIEVSVAILLFCNAIYVSLCWVYFNDIVFWLEINTEKKYFVVALIMGLVLFLIDSILTILLLPFARLANSSVLDGNLNE